MINLDVANVSVIIPAKNEGDSIGNLISDIKKLHPKFEILVVNDGSTDDTATVAKNNGAKVITHPYSMGNGAAVKTGARNASGDIFVFMDADGQHQAKDINTLLNKFASGFDMVVGARSKEHQANLSRHYANSLYNFIASNIVRQNILDLTSGFRAVEANKFREFLHLLPNGFSYPSTITIAFFRSGYSVCYQPIEVKERHGKSHIRPLTDGLRFLLILYKMTTLYSPFKVFLPFSILHFMAGLCNYGYTFFTQGRFTNMSALFFCASVIIFLIGLVSEQITTLMYQQPQSTRSQSRNKEFTVLSEE